MTPVPMTPLLAELVGNTEPASERTGARVLQARFGITPEGRQALVPPFVLVIEKANGVASIATAPNLDAALRLAKRCGGSGRIVRDRKTVGYWGELPKESL